jgi:hypothetical protein
MKKFCFAVLGAMLLVAPAQAHTKADLTAQLKLLMEWWPGRYDNNEQIVRQSGGGLSAPTDKPIYRLHTVFKRVTMPELGENVLYVEEWKNNNPTDIARIRLYSLSINEKEGAIAVKFYTPLDAKPLVGAHNDLARVEKLKLKDLRAFRDVCDVYLNWEGGQFRGGMKEKSCNVAEDKEWFQYQVIVGHKHYWARDRRFSYAEPNKVTWEMAPGSNYAWFEQSKARLMKCEVLADPNGDMTKTTKLTEIELHDQGGEADIKWPDGRDLSFVIHNRAFTSPPDREFPLFRIHDKKNMTVPIAYAYAVDDAERYGLNLGWFYIRCQVKK